MKVSGKEEKRKKKKEFAFTAKEIVHLYKSHEQAAFLEDAPEIEKTQFHQKNQIKKKQHIRRIIIYSISVAASILVVFGSYLWLNQPEKSKENDLFTYLDELSIGAISNEIQLFTSDSILNIREDECIKYEKDGNVILESSQSGKQSVIEKSRIETTYNRIIVPKGKRMNLILSDGTKIVINAGSQLVYPTAFTGEKREIYVEGEIFLNVKKDESRPFIVKTDLLDVRVLGTSFNVSAYKEDKETSIVLVCGKVQVKTRNNNIEELSPNERLCFKDDKIEKSIVNPYEYTCWTQSIMLLHCEPLDVVFKKLSRYYGFSIQYDKQVAEITMSGKLDLKEDLKNVINTIAYTAPITVSYEENRIIIRESK